MSIPIDRRDIAYEPIFDGASFRGKNLCDEALKIITKSELMVFTKLPPVAYPPIVKEFYKNFKVFTDEKGTTRVSVVISGEKYTFTRMDIATALKIKHYKVVGVKEKPDVMRARLTKGPNAASKGLRTSSLDERYWLVDKFLRHYVCPFSHFNEVPKYGYPFWYSLLTRSSVDVPLLVIEMMGRCLKSGKKSKPHALVLPRTITAILKVIRCNVNPSTDSVEDFGVFSYQSVKKSLDTLTRQARSKSKAPQEDEEEGEEEDEEEGEEEEEDNEAPRHDYDFGGSSGPSYPYTQPEGPSYDEWEAYTRNQGDWMHGVNQQLEEFGATMNNMHTMMQGFGPIMQGIGQSIQGLDSRVNVLETTVGGMRGQVDDYAYDQRATYMMNRLTISRNFDEHVANEIFTQADTYAESGQPRRRDRRRPNPSARNEDTTME